jgi:hypothetical protein
MRSAVERQSEEAEKAVRDIRRANRHEHESGSYTCDNDKRANVGARKPDQRSCFYTNGATRCYRNADTFQPGAASS